MTKRERSVNKFNFKKLVCKFSTPYVLQFFVFFICLVELCIVVTCNFTFFWSFVFYLVHNLL
jgi:hypothetical protein